MAVDALDRMSAMSQATQHVIVLIWAVGLAVLYAACIGHAV